METTIKNYKDAVITKLQIGVDNRIVPWSIEFQLHERDKGEIYEYFMKELDIKRAINASITPIEMLNLSETESKSRLKLMEQLKDCQTKITIKIELEKYE